jgi:site-specific DNA-methyltransferase (cytosine-N4-specific)
MVIKQFYYIIVKGRYCICLVILSIKNIKKDDIHETVLYPGVMVAPIQKEILKNIIQKDAIKSIFDPFHGSGTVLYEASEVSPDIHLVGCDINPLANLITLVKLQGVGKNIQRDSNSIENYVNNSPYAKTRF